MKPRFLRTIRLLAESYQAFEQKSARQARMKGLTLAQFDIVATLGRTPGMTFTELSRKTLITKGTLSGVLERLELRGVLVRESVPSDARKVMIRLTPDGEALFESAFFSHNEYFQPYWAEYSDADFDQLDAELTRLRDRLRRK